MIKPLDENTLTFRILINLDRLLNILLGGDIGVCLSTRAHIQSERLPASKKKEMWVFVRGLIDTIFWENHCEQSYEWEIKLKQAWVDANRLIPK